MQKGVNLKNKQFRLFVKKMSLLIIICILFTLFTGCYDNREVDELSYAIALGFDKGSTNALRLTMQLAVPLSIGGGEGSSGGKPEEKLDIVTVEAPTLYTGLDLINNSISKEINLSHAKLLVFSEELAREGLHKYLNAIIRGREFRPNTYIAVSRCPALDYIKTIKPVLDPQPAKYYELEYQEGLTGGIPSTKISDFYFATESLNKQAVATLAGVSKFESVNDFSKASSTNKEKGRLKPLEGDYKAGEIPKLGDIKGQIIGMAVFYGDKMVGDTDGEFANFYMMFTGKYKNTYWSIPDPKVKNTFVVINAKQSRNPEFKINMINGKPHIDIDIKIEADYESIQSGEDYEKNSEVFEAHAEKFFEKDMLIFLNKTSKEFKSDIMGFGREMKFKFLTWDEWKAFNWPKKYKDAVFNVTLDLKMRRPGLIIRSVKRS